MPRVLKNGDEKLGAGGNVDDNNILTFLCYWLDKKCHFKKLHFGQFFLFVFVRFVIHRLLYWFESFGTRPETDLISQFLVVQISSTKL